MKNMGLALIALVVGGFLVTTLALLMGMFHQMSEMNSVLLQVRDGLKQTNSGLNGISSNLGTGGDLYKGLDHIGGNLQSLRGDIHGLGASLAQANSQLTSVHSTLDRVVGQLGSVDGTIHGVSDKIGGLGTKLDRVVTPLTKISARIDTMQGDTHRMSGDLTQLQQRIATLD